MRGVVLLDLPDHDSTEVSHHLEVDRLVQLADLLVWVLDPQKYADAAIHDRYLAPLADPPRRDAGGPQPHRHRAAPTGASRCSPTSGGCSTPTASPACRCIADQRQDRRGHRPSCASEIASRVAAKKATRQRLEADLRGAAQRLDEATGSAPTPTLSQGAGRGARGRARRVGRACRPWSKAVDDSTRLRANRATGWPVVGVVLPAAARPAQAAPPRPRLVGPGSSPAGPARRCPRRPSVQRARVDAERARAGRRRRVQDLSRPWAARRPRGIAVAARRPRRPARPGSRRHRPRCRAGSPCGPGWCGCCSGCCCSPRSAAPCGWARCSPTRYLTFEMPDTPDVAGYPLPMLMLVGGVVLGILLALVCRLLVRGDRASPRADRRTPPPRGHLRGRRRAGGRAGAGRAGRLRRRPARASTRRCSRRACRLRSPVAVHSAAPAHLSSTGVRRRTGSSSVPPRFAGPGEPRLAAVRRGGDAMYETTVTLQGWLGGNVTTRVAGDALVANFRVASTPRRFQRTHRDLGRRRHPVVHRERVARAGRELPAVPAPRRPGGRARSADGQHLGQPRGRRESTLEIEATTSATT